MRSAKLLVAPCGESSHLCADAAHIAAPELKKQCCAFLQAFMNAQLSY
jgi:hypothetical protein